MRKSLLALVVGLGAIAAVAAVGLAWNGKADDVCREQAPATADGYTVRWEWGELAYVCDYAGPEPDPRRVGIVEAFHGDGRNRHPG